MRARHLLAAALAVAWALPARAGEVQVMFFRGGDPAPAARTVRIPQGASRGDAVAAVLRALVTGPDRVERAAGLRSAFPPGTTVDAVQIHEGAVTITLGMDVPPPPYEAAAWDDLQAQVINTLGSTHPDLRDFTFRVNTAGGVTPLRDLLAKPRAVPPPGPGAARSLRPDAAPKGALTGRRVAVSPGHGWVWNGSIWSPQRGDVGGLIEDYLTQDICLHWLVPYLEKAGAQVITARERDFVTNEIILDNGRPGYSEIGAWSAGGTPGGYQHGYRFSPAFPEGASQATYRMDIPEPGNYRVSIWFAPGPDRAVDVPVTVGHARGETSFHVDQSAGVPTWVYLDPFFFYDTATVTVLARSATAGLAIADAVRLGGGFGSIDRGGGPSLKPRWQEAARYFTQYAGAPAGVYEGNGPGASDHSNDVVSRPLFAAWAQAELFLSVHTNAYNGAQSGTETYAYNGGATLGSELLRHLVNRRVVEDIRAGWDRRWRDRGEKGANLGEVREAQGMPAALVELAFHDGTKGVRDNEYLHDAQFKRLLGRALYRAIAEYLAPGQPFITDPPTAVSLVNSAPGELTATWSPTPGAVEYRVHLSQDGCGTGDGIPATDARLVLKDLVPGGTYFIRVTAVNAGGESFPSPVVAARVADDRGWVPLLLVHAFDRLDAEVQIDDNPGIWMVPHAVAAAAAGYFFDGATHAAVGGASMLAPYAAVDWILGRQGAGGGLFTADGQAMLASYLDGGGGLFISGTGIASELGLRGSAADKRFLRDYLSALFAEDDAEIRQVRPAAGGIFDSVPQFSFDDGTWGTYDAASPDVISPAEGGAPALTYLGGKVAAVSSAGAHKSVYLAFPFETIFDHAVAVGVMARALAFLAGEPPPDVEKEPGPSVGDGGVPGEDAGAPCATGAMRCGDEGGVEVCLNGVWIPAGVCAPGSLCIAGRCVVAGQCAGVQPGNMDPVIKGPNGCGCTTLAVGG